MAFPGNMPTPTALLFDIDGTLVDSTYLHIDAWHQAFASVGHAVDAWRIHRAIGMDSTRLIERLLGDDAAALADRAKDEHQRVYFASTWRLRAFDQATDLLRAVHERGVAVVLATSAPQRELDALLDVLGASDAIDVVTSGEDVKTAKPDPQVVEVALERAAVAAGSALLVGDAVWDIRAASNAGVASVGVQSGGYGEEELLAAGAIAVYEDAADVLAHLDDLPVVGPGALHPDDETDERRGTT